MQTVCRVRERGAPAGLFAELDAIRSFVLGEVVHFGGWGVAGSAINVCRFIQRAFIACSRCFVLAFAADRRTYATPVSSFVHSEENEGEDAAPAPGRRGSPQDHAQHDSILGRGGPCRNGPIGLGGRVFGDHPATPRLDLIRGLQTGPTGKRLP